MKGWGVTMVGSIRSRAIFIVLLAIAFSTSTILLAGPRCAFAKTPASEIAQAAEKYVQMVSLMQPNVSGSGDCSWDPMLHRFVGMPNADDAFFVGYAQGLFDDLCSGEYYEQEDDSAHVPRILLEAKLAERFTVVPDLRDRVAYPFLASVRYEASEDAFVFPSIEGKGLSSLAIEFQLCSEVATDTYDVYMKVALDRWAQNADLSDPTRYVVHRLRIQRSGDAWRYLSFDSVDHDANGAVSIVVEKNDGLGFKGDWRGLVQGIVSLAASRLDEASYDERFACIPRLLDVFDVKFKIDGEVAHDGFGTLDIDFPVDERNNGYWIILHHLHENGEITTHRSIAKDGIVSLKVTDLSSFALERGERASDEAMPFGSNDSATADECSFEDVDAPIDGTTSMVSPKTGQGTVGSSRAIATLMVFVSIALITLLMLGERGAARSIR